MNVVGFKVLFKKIKWTVDMLIKKFIQGLGTFVNLDNEANSTACLVPLDSCCTAMVTSQTQIKATCSQFSQLFILCKSVKF